MTRIGIIILLLLPMAARGILPARRQMVETVGVAYNLLGGAGFGAVAPDRD